MEKILIMTDSNSGIQQTEAKDMGIYVLPMPFTIDGEEYEEEINITQQKFYEILTLDTDVKTSQPSQLHLESIWDKYLKEYEEIVYIPMSSGLSSTCENAKKYALKYAGKIEVVDNMRISVAQKESVLEAIELAKQGKTAKEIKEYLENTKDKESIYITVDNLKYLKKGGRVSGAAATLGSLLNVKPILCSRGGKFDKFALALSFNQAKKRMIAQIKHELETEFKEEYEHGKMTVSVAHTNNYEMAEEFKSEIQKILPNVKFRFIDPLSLSVSCHIGSGALAVCICINNYL